MLHEIIINGTTTIYAEGNHARKCFKTVAWLEQGLTFASVKDAAEYLEMSPSTVSEICNGKRRCPAGITLFFVTEAMEHYNKMMVFIRGTEDRYLAARTKAKAYDAITTEQNAKQDLKDRIATHKANIGNIDAKIAQLNAEREKEIILLEEAKLDLKELLADDLEYLM